MQSFLVADARPCLQRRWLEHMLAWRSTDSEFLLDQLALLEEPQASKIKDQVLSWLLPDFKMSRFELDELQDGEEVEGRLKAGGLNMSRRANKVLRAAFLRI